MVDWTRVSFAIDGYPLRLDKGHNLEHRAFSHCGKAFWREWRQDRHPREQRSDLSPSSRRRGSPSFWRAMARRRHFGHSARRRSRHRRCSRLVYCIAQHGYSRHVGLSTHPYSIFTSGRATKSVLAQPPLPVSPASSYRHWPSSVAPAGTDLITPAGRTRGSHQSGGRNQARPQ
jgi:hypothetical protein